MYFRFGGTNNGSIDDVDMLRSLVVVISLGAPDEREWRRKEYIENSTDGWQKTYCEYLSVTDCVTPERVRRRTVQQQSVWYFRKSCYFLLEEIE